MSRRSAMCHVLIIEDEWLIAEHLAGLAEDAGATLIGIATTEREAIEAARERRPDIILSDVRLQEGTGPSAVAAIRCKQGEIPVIFITGTPEDCQRRCSSAIVLTKPIDNASVLSAFRRLAPV
jgi:CheY-like chemotaxis protein